MIPHNKRGCFLSFHQCDSSYLVLVQQRALEWFSGHFWYKCFPSAFLGTLKNREPQPQHHNKQSSTNTKTSQNNLVNRNKSVIFGVIHKEDDISHFCFITLSAHPTQIPKQGSSQIQWFSSLEEPSKETKTSYWTSNQCLQTQTTFPQFRWQKHAGFKFSALVPCNSTKEWGWCVREGNWSTQLTRLLHTGNNFRGKFQKRNLIPWQYRQEISLCFLSSRPDLNQAVM